MRLSLVLTAVVLVAAAAVVSRYMLGPEPLHIYSSLPELEQRQPASVSLRGVVSAPAVAKSVRVADMEDAIRLALRQGGDKTGASPASLVEANAKRVAEDDHAAAYIGDFTSG